jgi:hypothetical protein
VPCRIACNHIVTGKQEQPANDKKKLLHQENANIITADTVRSQTQNLKN